MKQILTLLIFVLSISIAKASCLACWELRKVEITLTNGEIVSGYVEWNELWLSDDSLYNLWHNKFPESLVPYYRSLKYERKILLYKEIFKIKNDSIDEFIATKQECVLHLDYRQVKSVKEIDKNLKKYEGADDVPILTQSEIDKLKTNPFATFYVNFSVYDVYYLSYNPAITRIQLSKITEANSEQMEPEMKAKGVIVYTIGYD